MQTFGQRELPYRKASADVHPALFRLRRSERTELLLRCDEHALRVPVEDTFLRLCKRGTQLAGKNSVLAGGEGQVGLELLGYVLVPRGSFPSDISCDVGCPDLGPFQYPDPLSG